MSPSHHGEQTNLNHSGAESSINGHQPAALGGENGIHPSFYPMGSQIVPVHNMMQSVFNPNLLGQVITGVSPSGTSQMVLTPIQSHLGGSMGHQHQHIHQPPSIQIIPTGVHLPQQEQQQNPSGQSNGGSELLPGNGQYNDIHGQAIPLNPVSSQQLQQGEVEQLNNSIPMGSAGGEDHQSQ